MRFEGAGPHPSRRRLRRLLRIRKTGWRLRSLLLGGGQIGENAHVVAFLHDQQFLAVELDLGAGPFAEQNAVADLEVDRDQLAGFIPATRTYRRDFALRGLFLGAVGNDDAALGLLLSIDTFDHDTVMQWAKCGFSHGGSFGGLFCWSICRRRRPWNTGVFETAWGTYYVILAIKYLECQ